MRRAHPSCSARLWERVTWRAWFVLHASPGFCCHRLCCGVRAFRPAASRKMPAVEAWSKEPAQVRFRQKFFVSGGVSQLGRMLFAHSLRAKAATLDVNCWGVQTALDLRAFQCRCTPRSCLRKQVVPGRCGTRNCSKRPRPSVAGSVEHELFRVRDLREPAPPRSGVEQLRSRTSRAA